MRINKPNVSLDAFKSRLPSPDKLQALTKSKLERKTRRRFIRYGLVFGNALLLIGVAAFIIHNRSTSQTIRSSTLASFASTNTSKTTPLDQLSSAQIALTAARMTRLPETIAIRNQADSDSILLQNIPGDSASVAKPLIVGSGQKSKHDIVEYVVKEGETVASIANHLGITGDTIRWSNNLSSNNVAVGSKLLIPPVNGIVYTVKAGDTAGNLASRYGADEAQIISFNDAEIGGLKVGDRIIIPNGRPTPPAARNTYIAFTASYGGNGYDFGYCTWYVASQIAVPTNWGNANTWDNYAALSGWTVSGRPRAGAIAQNNGGWLGHVGIVNEVSADGMMIKYSDMNGLAGWGRVGSSDWVPISKFQHYIYK